MTSVKTVQNAEAGATKLPWRGALGACMLCVFVFVACMFFRGFAFATTSDDASADAEASASAALATEPPAATPEEPVASSASGTAASPHGTAWVDVKELPFAAQIADQMPKSIGVGKSSTNGFSTVPSSGAAASSARPGQSSATSDGASASGSVVNASPMPTIPNPTTEEFIASIAEQAREIGQERGLYASVMIAQAVLESGSGSSGLSKPPYNNLFGIKGTYRGRAVHMLTSEDDGTGRRYDIVAAFRRYPSTRESLEDYADLLTKSMATFYAPAWKANARTYVDACNYLQGHYATSTSYSSSLQGLIIAYNLEQYDHPATAEGAGQAEEDRAAATFVGASLAPSADSASEASSAASTEAVQANARVVRQGGSQSIGDAIEADAAVSQPQITETPAAQVVAFGACPLAVLLLALARGGSAQIALSALSPARIASRIAALIKGL